MGTNEMSALDPTSMRAHGVEGPRAVDASVMPYVTNGARSCPVDLRGSGRGVWCGASQNRHRGAHKQAG
jgi:choline dehydrogenase-like flavoprotein